FGTEHLPNAVTLQASMQNGALFLEGKCSCTVANCKHAAALALFLRQAQDDSRAAQDDTPEEFELPVVDLEDDVDPDPTPVLRLGKGPSAELLFEYDSGLVHPDNARPIHLPFERRCVERLREFGLAYADRDKWLHFSNAVLPELQYEGWRIETDPSF